MAVSLVDIFVDAHCGLLHKLDGAFAEAARRHPDLVTCAPGCDNCCTHPFDIRLLEAVYLCRGVRSLEEGTASLVRANAQAALAAMRELPGADDPNVMPVSGDELSGRIERMKGMRLPCPALLDGRCGVYGHRMAMCRIFGVPFALSADDPVRVCPRSGFILDGGYPAAMIGGVLAAIDKLDAELLRAVSGAAVSRPVRLSAASAIAADLDEGKVIALAAVLLREAVA